MDTPMGAPSPYYQPPSAAQTLVSPMGLLCFGLLLFVLPLVALTAESFILPFIETNPLLNFGQDVAAANPLPWQFYLKAFIFFALGIWLVGYLILQMKLGFLRTWAAGFSRPDPLHVDYCPHPIASVQAVLRWKAYRFLVIAVPPLVLVGIFFGLAWIGLFVMNTVMDLSTLALPSALTVCMFIGLMLGIITFLSVLNGLWLMVNTVFGDVAAALEPDLPARAVFDRVRRVGLQSKGVYWLYPGVVIFWVLAIAFLVWLLLSFDIQDMVEWRFPWVTALAMELGLAASYLVMNYVTLYSYHDALRLYYRELPPAFRERFMAPE